jgi:hypothetical protein
MCHVANGIMDRMDSMAAAEFEIVKVSSGLIRRVVSSVFSLLSLSSGAATLPRWSRYEIRERRSGKLLRTVNDAVDGRDVDFELHRDLNAPCCAGQACDNPCDGRCESGRLVLGRAVRRGTLASVIVFTVVVVGVAAIAGLDIALTKAATVLFG